MNKDDYTEKLTQASRQCIVDGGESYRVYHREFKRKSICTKAMAVVKALPTYIWFKWFAPPEQRYIYNGLLAHLSRRING